MARSARVARLVRLGLDLATILRCCLIYALVPFNGWGLALTRADKALASDGPYRGLLRPCLLYTSDAADE